MSNLKELFYEFVVLRHHELVDKKWTVGLSIDEQTEIRMLKQTLDTYSEEFYRPILERLRSQGQPL